MTRQDVRRSWVERLKVKTTSQPKEECWNYEYSGNQVYVSSSEPSLIWAGYRIQPERDRGKCAKRVLLVLLVSTSDSRFQ